MNVKVENLEKNMAKLTIEVDADKVDEALNKEYNRQKNKMSVPGFRKGKVPRQMIEKMYGPEIFYEGASNILLQETYPEAYDESGLEIVSQPKVEIEQLEKGKPFIYTAEVAVKPEVTLGKYMGITVTKVDTDVTDAEIEERLKEEQKKSAREVKVEDRAVENGDVVDIDFEGFKDGVAFDGGKGEHYKLEIGSHSFVDTFEDQLVGKNIGDDVEVNVTFPEDYGQPSLAGAPALFKVHIHGITVKELPELDDDFAGDAGFDSMDEYKEDIKKSLAETKEKNARREQEDEAVEKIVADSKMDIPEAMIEHQIDNEIREMSQSMRYQGLSFDQYLQFTGMTMDKMREQIRPESLKRIQSSLVLEAIAKAENVEANDADIEKEIEEMASMYGMKPEDLNHNIGDEERENMKKDICIKKALDIVMDNSKKRAKAKKKAKDEGEAEE
ncbi:MAG: trigger factor [Lachnospiraceae bacterium]|nr:trigger factor [Lachnospiraceae bacterium]